MWHGTSCPRCIGELLAHQKNSMIRARTTKKRNSTHDQAEIEHSSYVPVFLAPSCAILMSWKYVHTLQQTN